MRTGHEDSLHSLLKTVFSTSSKTDVTPHSVPQTQDQSHPWTTTESELEDPAVGRRLNPNADGSQNPFLVSAEGRNPTVVSTMSSVLTKAFLSSNLPTSTRVIHQGTSAAIVARSVVLDPAITSSGPTLGHHHVRRASDATATSSHCPSTATDCVDLSYGISSADLTATTDESEPAEKFNNRWAFPVSMSIAGALILLFILVAILVACFPGWRTRLMRWVKTKRESTWRVSTLKEKRERRAARRQERAQGRELDEFGSNSSRRRTVDGQNDIEANGAKEPTLEVTDSRDPPSRSGSGEAGSSSDKTEATKSESDSDQGKSPQEPSAMV
jgi:hypothetical protein